MRCGLFLHLSQHHKTDFRRSETRQRHKQTERRCVSVSYLQRISDFLALLLLGTFYQPNMDPKTAPFSHHGVCVWTGVCVCVFGCNNHHGDLHGVTVGVGQVAEDEQRSLLGQRLSHGEVPQLRADVLYSGALWHTHTHTHTPTGQISICTAGEEQSASNSSSVCCRCSQSERPGPAGDTVAQISDLYLCRRNRFTSIHKSLVRAAAGGQLRFNETLVNN